MKRTIFTYLITALVVFGCANELEMNGSSTQVKDSGWLASDSYEIEAVIQGTVVQKDGGEWDGLAMDPTLQAKLVDTD